MRILLCVGLILWSASQCLHAADGAGEQGGQPALTRSPRAPDFLVGSPRGWVTFSGGLQLPRAGGDLFAFFGDQLTIDRRDFRARSFGVEAGAMLSSHLQVVGGIDGGSRRQASEYRRFISSADTPIEQSTSLMQISATAGIRYTPLGRGTRLSRLVYIPRRLQPFVGGGVNLGYYDLSQGGQFVDAADRSIFNHYFQSSGFGVGPYAQAGADIQVWRMLFLHVQGKYSWIRSSLDDDFVGFNGIDLSGFRAGTGLTVVF